MKRDRLLQKYDKKIIGIGEMYPLLSRPRSKRIPRKRNYMYATELGKSTAEVVLNMAGFEPSNVPDFRGMGKMEAGSMWEDIIARKLIQAGVPFQREVTLNNEFVHGRLDFLLSLKKGKKKKVGRIKKFLMKKLSVEAYSLPEGINSAVDKLGKDLLKLAGEDIFIELKSTSAMSFNFLEREEDARPHHKLQLFHYMKVGGVKIGYILYLCRDSSRLHLYPVFLEDEYLEEKYNNKIAEVKRVYKSFTGNISQLPLEPLIVAKEGKLSTNWNIQYNNFLTTLYGFKNEGEYREQISKRVSSFNSVIKRIRDKKNMTDKNLKYIEEAKTLYNLDLFTLAKHIF